MNFFKGKIKEFYLYTTEIENIFINEYMPLAPGDFVKVYLYGLMYAQRNEEMSHERLAKELHLSKEELDKAWTYWENIKAIKKVPCSEGGSLGYDVEFVNLRELMYSNPAQGDGRKPPDNHIKYMEKSLECGNLKEMLSDIEKVCGKMLSARETEEIYSWIKDWNATPEIICYAYKYCSEKGKTNCRYVATVVGEWTKKGFSTKEQAAEFLGELDQRYSVHKRVLQSLGLNRQATEAEREIIDRWFDEMNFTMERVLDACGTTVSISNPNLKYVNKVLENWYNEAKEGGRDVNKKVTITQAQLNNYYSFLRRKSEDEAQERKEQVYTKIPRIEEIDRQFSEMGSRLSKSLLSDREGSQVKEIKRILSMLEEERAVLLTEHNFNVDYTDIKYSCEKCSDTGFTEDGQRCSCSKKRIEEAEIWQKSN